MKNFTFVPSCRESVDILNLLGCSFEIKENAVSEVLLKKETPVKFVDRITPLKAEGVDGNVLCAFKCVFVGRRLMPIPQNDDDIRRILKLYSGGNHDVHCGVFMRRANGTTALRRTVTRVKMKHLSLEEFEGYVKSKAWVGKIGGYGFDDIFQSYIIKTIGSMTGLKGLALYEAKNLIQNF